MRGIIKGISGHHIWIEAKSPVEFAINTEVDIDIKEHKEKRSLNANAYFHELHKSGIAMDFSKMLGQAIWEKNYYMDLYNNLNKTKIDEARDRFRELNTNGSYM